MLPPLMSYSLAPSSTMMSCTVHSPTDSLAQPSCIVVYIVCNPAPRGSPFELSLGYAQTSQVLSSPPPQSPLVWWFVLGLALGRLNYVSDIWNMFTPYIYQHRTVERTFVMYLYFLFNNTLHFSYLPLLYLINSGSYSRMLKWLLLGFSRFLKMIGIFLILPEYFPMKYLSDTLAWLHHL